MIKLGILIIHDQLLEFFEECNMPLEIQKMIVGNQKPPSTIFQQGRFGEFFFVPLNSSFLFVWVFLHANYLFTVSIHYQPSIKKQYRPLQYGSVGNRKD